MPSVVEPPPLEVWESRALRWIPRAVLGVGLLGVALSLSAAHGTFARQSFILFLATLMIWAVMIGTLRYASKPPMLMADVPNERFQPAVVGGAGLMALLILMDLIVLSWQPVLGGLAGALNIALLVIAHLLCGAWEWLVVRRSLIDGAWTRCTSRAR
jgi:hypothetical protein